ncbi:MAG: MBOAT family O-acyltransferase [Acidobacteriota bacterium]
MVFSSLTFLFVFLPPVLAGYKVLPQAARRAFLLAASLLFYAWGGGFFVVLLLASTAVDYAAGRRVAAGVEAGDRGRVRSGVAFSVGVNLGLLGYFKYANFLVGEINRVSAVLGLGEIAWTSVALPIGISFYTFQSMSYTIDLARGRARPARSLVDFALYVALFPQLIAGPIVRYHELDGQLRAPARQPPGLFADGVVRFSHGLVKKVVIADAAGAVANAAFAVPGAGLTTADAWLGVVAYHVQIYFDFSGYSDMAIGLGAMFGLRLPENFERPYSALSVTDFWRRWHQSLSRWFRDYLYIPLGGSRGTAAETTRNLWLVFLLVGLWHGATWMFVLWGIYHGALLAFERWTGQRPAGDEVAGMPVLRRAVVALLVLAGWVLFRGQDLSQAGNFFAAMAGFGAGQGLSPAVAEALTHRHLLLLALGVAVHALPGHFVTGPWLLGVGRAPRLARWLLLLSALPYALVLVASGSFSPFLYFQF